MASFLPGDRVRGLESANEVYSITRSGWEGVVVEVHGQDIEVSGPGLSRTASVSPAFFELVEARAGEFKCNTCEQVIGREATQARGRDFYCEECYQDNFLRVCDRCGEDVDLDSVFDHAGGSYCRECYYRETDECSECCYDEDESDDEPSYRTLRDYETDPLPEFMSDKPGSIIKSSRIFSAEIEAYYPDGETLKEVARELPQAFGVSGDGSLGARGIEFQTPMLQGKAGEMAVIGACSILNSAGFTTNRSTGLHIHLDGKGLTDNIAAIRRAFAFYLAAEDVVLSFLPPSRRTNSYCKRLSSDYHAKEVLEARTVKALEKIWYRATRRDAIERRKGDKYDPSRYAGVNFHSLLANGHIEIRYHSGTTSAEKILEWVAFHQAILDRAVSGELSAYSELITCTPSLQEKTELVYRALDLPPRARAYFTGRQNTFAKTVQDKDEAQSVASELAEGEGVEMADEAAEVCAA